MCYWCTLWLYTSLDLVDFVMNLLLNLVYVGLLLSFLPQNQDVFAKFGSRPLFDDTLKFHWTNRLFYTLGARNALYLHSGTLWDKTFRNFVHPNTCSQCADAVFSFFGQSRPQVFKKFGHKCVKLLNIYIFLYLDVLLVYSMTLHLSRPCGFCYESFVKSSLCRSALVIFTTKPGRFRQIRFQAPFRWYPKIPLNE